MNAPEVRHVSVLSRAVLDLLAPKAGEIFVDATVGAGGHARLLAERLGPGGRLVALDQDETMLALARQRLQGVACPVTWMHANFERLRDVLDEAGVKAVDGVLADLGVSSDQLDAPERGLSFQQPGPLDMRLDRTTGATAADLLQALDERELADIFWRYGEERFSRRVARRIVQTRKQSPLQTTEQLADLARSCVPRAKGRQRIDPATRVFQALRIAVNDEMGALARFLEALPACVRPGGRVAIISFHSLEDRQVKHAFRGKETWEALTRKPVQADDDEMRANPRSRSAKLRVARRIPRAVGFDT